MKIIPTLDILNSLFVNAIGGQRDRYQPSVNVYNSSNPLKVISSLKYNFGLEELYIADLDGIIKGQINISLISKICGINDIRVFIDAGIYNTEKAQILLDKGVFNVIIGTETLTNLNLIKELSNISTMSSFSASLDIINETIISKCPELHGLHPLEAALILEKEGFELLLLIDISRVGKMLGCNWKIVKEITESLSIPIIVGGGIGSIQDILKLRKIGVEGVLIGSLLHKGILSKKEIDIIVNL